MGNFPLKSVKGMAASSKANPAPLAPTSTEPCLQKTPVDGFPVEGSERKPGMGSLSGFSSESHLNEPAGASFRVRQSYGGSTTEALNPVMSPNWLGGKILGPAVPRWEEQPNRGADDRTLNPGENVTVAPTSSSY